MGSIFKVSFWLERKPDILPMELDPGEFTVHNHNLLVFKPFLGDLGFRMVALSKWNGMYLKYG